MTNILTFVLGVRSHSTTATMPIPSTILVLSAYSSLSLAALVSTSDHHHPVEQVSTATRNVPLQHNYQLLTILRENDNISAINAAINQQEKNNDPYSMKDNQVNLVSNHHIQKKLHTQLSSDGAGPEVSEIHPSNDIVSVCVASIVVGLCVSYMVVFLAGVMLAEWKKGRGKSLYHLDVNNDMKHQPVQVAVS